MALGGISPLLVFSFKKTKYPGDFNAIDGAPILDRALNAIGFVPIPIYLDESLTGIYIDTESRAIDIETVPQARNDGLPPIVNQRGLNSLVTVNLLAKNNAALLSVIFAFSDMVFQKVISQEYSVSYFNGPTVIVGGLLHGFSSQSGSDDDLLRLTLQISKANQGSTIPPNLTSELAKHTGAFPLTTPVAP